MGAENDRHEREAEIVQAQRWYDSRLAVSHASEHFSWQRPILLKGHERPITHLKYNRESDLLFTCSKDSKPNVWFASNGDRLGNTVFSCIGFLNSKSVVSGTYNGHEGAVSELDVNFNSTLLLTGSADTTARFWDVQTGKCKFVFKHKAPVRSVCFSEGDQTFLSVGDKALGQEATIFIYPVAEDEAERALLCAEI